MVEEYWRENMLSKFLKKKGVGKERFDRLVERLKRRGARNPYALANWIFNKKYGKKGG